MLPPDCGARSPDPLHMHLESRVPGIGAQLTPHLWLSPVDQTPQPPLLGRSPEHPEVVAVQRTLQLQLKFARLELQQLQLPLLPAFSVLLQLAASLIQQFEHLVGLLPCVELSRGPSQRRLLWTSFGSHLLEQPRFATLFPSALLLAPHQACAVFGATVCAAGHQVSVVSGHAVVRRLWLLEWPRPISLALTFSREQLTSMQVAFQACILHWQLVVQVLVSVPSSPATKIQELPVVFPPLLPPDCGALSLGPLHMHLEGGVLVIGAQLAPHLWLSPTDQSPEPPKPLLPVGALIPLPPPLAAPIAPVLQVRQLGRTPFSVPLCEPLPEPASKLALHEPRQLHFPAAQPHVLTSLLVSQLSAWHQAALQRLCCHRPCLCNICLVLPLEPTRRSWKFDALSIELSARHPQIECQSGNSYHRLCYNHHGKLSTHCHRCQAPQNHLTNLHLQNRRRLLG